MHISHVPISIFHFFAWWNDKSSTLLTHKLRYFILLIPTIITLLAGIASLLSFWGIDANEINFLPYLQPLILLIFINSSLYVFLFFLVTSRNQCDLRLKRLHESIETMHCDVIHKVRDFRVEINRGMVKSEDIEKYILNILQSFNDSYMKSVYRKGCNATLKYLFKEHLYDLRTGIGKDRRNNQPEHYYECYVYLRLNPQKSKDQKKREYIYVKNINFPDKKEIEMMGDYIKEIQNRSKGHYKTFLAMPLRSGESFSGQKRTNVVWKPKDDLGFIGFDVNEKYGLGSMQEFELNYIACFVDLMSELVQCLIETKP